MVYTPRQGCLLSLSRLFRDCTSIERTFSELLLLYSPAPTLQKHDLFWVASEQVLEHGMKFLLCRRTVGTLYLASENALSFFFFLMRSVLCHLNNSNSTYPSSAQQQLGREMRSLTLMIEFEIASETSSEYFLFSFLCAGVLAAVAVPGPRRSWGQDFEAVCDSGAELSSLATRAVDRTSRNFTMPGKGLYWGLLLI